MNITSRKLTWNIRVFLTGLILICLAWPPQTGASARELTPPPDDGAVDEAPLNPIEILPATVEAPQAMETPPAVQLIQATVEVPPRPIEPAETGPASVELILAPVDESREQTGSMDNAFKDLPEEETPGIPVAELVANMANENLVLVDESGGQFPLASTLAADLLKVSDPYFTSAGVTYGWTAAGSPENPVCSQAVTEGFCTFSQNPINDAIASPLYTGQQLTIEAGDYSLNNVTITKMVDFNPRASLTAASITLSEGAVVNWSTSGGGQYYLTSMNIFVNPGALLADAMELAASGAEIALSPGVFDDDLGVEITKPVTIRGSGSAATILLPHSSCSRCSRYFLVNADGVKIHDLKLDGQYRVETGILVDNHTGLEVFNNEFVDLFTNGVLVGDIGPSSGGDADTIATASYNIHDNLFRHILAGGSTSEGSGIKVIDNAGPAAEHIISGNIFTQNNRAVWVRDSSVTLSGNDFFANKYGLFVEDLDSGMEMSVRYNRFFGNTSKGINYSANATNDPVVNAADNWWGCSGGAGSPGCDAIASAKANKIDASSYLKLGLRADPSSAAVGGLVTLAAFMFSSSDPARAALTGLSWFGSPAVAPIGSLLGNMDGNTFYPTDEGVQTFRAVFDNGSADVQITVEGVDCQPGTSDPDGDNECETTACLPGFFDGDSDGACEETNCSAGSFDSDSDGDCEPVVCDDHNPRTQNIPNPDGSCSYPEIECDDGLATTDDLLNDDGTCAFPLKSCEDGQAKTVDTLNPDGSCSHELIVCTDGLPTTIDTLNEDGSCSFDLISCEDGQAKTVDTLNPDGSCSHEMIECDDRLATTEDILNDDGSCSFPLKSCNDGNLKTTDVLQSDGSCAYNPIVCNDDLPTTVDILNDDGSCSFMLKSCLDGDPRTVDILNPDGSCDNSLRVCDDGIPVTDNILNQDGTCAFPLKTCDDGSPRTEDILQSDGSCRFTLIVCADGDPRTEDILNQDGTCSFVQKSCDDGNPRTEDSLNLDGSCSQALKVCDDGQPRTENILNPDGTCIFPLKTCDDSNPATEDTLQIDGTCTFSPVVIQGGAGELDVLGQANTDADSRESGFLQNLLLQSSPDYPGGGIIPVTSGLVGLGGGRPVVLASADGTIVSFNLPLEGFEAGLAEEAPDLLPKPLPDGLKFAKALSIFVTYSQTVFPFLPEPARMTVKFKIPEDFDGMATTILFWNPELEAGQGEWVDLGELIARNPEMESQGIPVDENRIVISYSTSETREIETTVNFTGVFVLAGIPGTLE